MLGEAEMLGEAKCLGKQNAWGMLRPLMVTANNFNG